MSRSVKCDTSPFSALTLLNGQQQGQQACSGVDSDDLTGALHILVAPVISIILVPVKSRIVAF